MDNQPFAPQPNPTPTPDFEPSPAPVTPASGQTQGSVVEPVPAQPFGPSAPGTLPPVDHAIVSGQPAPAANVPVNSAAPQSPVAPVLKRSKTANRNLIETILLISISLLAVTFIGLFIWKYLEWDAIKTDVDGQVEAAVAMAVAENTTKLEAEFTEREKYPYKTFTGPADYGSLSFEYPKTWNLYISRDASSGGDFEAYLNPGEVQPVSATTINALRVIIRDTAFDSIVRTYDSSVQSGRLSVITRNVGSAVANVYTGELGTDIHGIVAAFKLRDKTVLLQTDAMLFADEYYKLLDSVTFVE